MRLEIKNDTLYNCMLDVGETQIHIPDTVQYIEADAFADIPSGQLKHLVLNEGLEGFHPDAFRGIHELETLVAYSHDFEKRGEYLLDSASVLKPDTLLILPGLDGNFFGLSSMLDDQYPHHLVTYSDIDVRYCGRENSEGDYVGFDGVRELTLFIKDTPRWGYNLFTNTQMRFRLKTLRFINSRYRDRNDETCIYSIAPSFGKDGQMKLPKRLKLAESFQWSPCSFGQMVEEEVHALPWFGGGLRDLEALEEVILPEGLIDIGDGMFTNCPLLRNVVVPSTVQWIGERAFQNNGSLQSVVLSNRVLGHIGVGIFTGCPQLKKISIYEVENPYRVVLRVSKQEIWKRITLNHAITLANECWPELAEETHEKMKLVQSNGDICAYERQFLSHLVGSIRRDCRKLADKEIAVVNLISSL